MKIKHLPNSISPYEDFGYSRIPEKPIAQDMIILNCRIEEQENGIAFPELRLVVNNTVVDIPAIAEYIKADEKGEYYSFSIGSYRTGDQVKYQFCCRDGEQEITSCWYEFEIYNKLSYPAPEHIYYDENSVLLQFTHKEAEDLYIELQLMEKQVVIHTGCKKEQSIRNQSISKQSISKQQFISKQMNQSQIWRREQYILQVEMNPFSLTIRDTSGDPLIEFIENKHQLRILMDKKQTIKNISLQCNMKANGLYGFGEKFNRVNQLGLETKNYVYEHFTHQNEKSYLPVPFFFTDAGYGMFYDTNFPVNFTSKKEENKVLFTMEAASDNLEELDKLYLLFGEPQSILSQYLDLTGECLLPPKWAFGPWMSANGWNTQKETMEQIDKMKLYQIPASVLVLEAWSDETTFYLFNDTKYLPKDGEDRLTYEDCHFEEDGKWPDPKGMTKVLHDNNVKLILWQIPVIKYMDNNENSQHVNDEEYAIRMGYCIKDKDGKPFRLPDRWFANSLVPDFTNQELREWWFSKRRYLLEEVGVDGFKTDGAEFIYDNQSIFNNGKHGEEMRNPYPNLYLEAYQDFLKQYKGEGQGVLFSRAGYTGAQRYPIHWAGDQMSEYEEFRSQVKAGLSAGLSGVIFWGFDIAGFAGDLPTTDLFLRSTAMAAFSPIMQFHAEPRTGQFFYEERKSWNNDRSPWNMAEVNEEPKILEVYRKFANIRMNLMPYIYNEAIYCSKHGRPMFAHLLLDYPMEKKVMDIEDEYLFGRSLLVAPVIQEGLVSRRVYLPTGIWYDFFTGKSYEGGCEFEYACPLGEIPVFVKEGHAIALNLADSLKIADFVGNIQDSYQCFAVKTFGNQGSLEFLDDIGNQFNLTWDGNEKVTHGMLPQGMCIL